MSQLKKLIDDVLKKQRLTSYFQPIVDLDKREIHAYEALIRGPSDTALFSPVELLSTAERFNLSSQMERLCRQTNINHFAEKKLKGKLFINICPTVLLDAKDKQLAMLETLEQANIDPSTVVIELTEYRTIDDYQQFRDVLFSYREMGFEIALDDLGAGYSGLRVWTELLPDYVKIDQHFIRNINKIPIKLNFVRSLQNMAQATNCKIIAEGVETEAEYKTISQLGISYAQGYYFARPEPNPMTRLPAGILKEKEDTIVHQVQPSTHINSILKKAIVISSRELNLNVLEIFQKNSDITVIALVEEGRPVGLVYKEKFLSKLFASRFGLELYGTKEVSQFIDAAPAMFDCHEGIEQVSQQLTEMQYQESAFIITDNGQYCGIGTVMDLLKIMTSQQLQNAQHANPLTLLPGIIPVNQKIDELIAAEVQFSVAYVDLDNFKPFNDIYSYAKGDEAIKLVARQLEKLAELLNGFVGHIGGDDFILVFTEADWEQACQQFLDDFAQQSKKLYSIEHQQAGGINAFDRQGKPCFYPLLSLSIGVVTDEAVVGCQSHLEVANLATEAKHFAKKIPGNSYFVNRRLEQQPANSLNDIQNNAAA